MKLLTTHEPFRIEFTLEELQEVEVALQDAHASGFQRMKQLLENTGLSDRISPSSLVEMTRKMLDELERLELWDEPHDDLWEDEEDDEWLHGPLVPCLMPRSTPDG